MNLTVALAVAAIGLAAPLSVLAQSSTEAVGAVNEDVLAATSANIQGEAIAYPTGTPEISSWIGSTALPGRLVSEGKRAGQQAKGMTCL